MFGSKFRTWMEAHIVRPRKKNQRQEKENGALLAGKTILPGSSILQNTPVETDIYKQHNNSIHNSDSGSQLGVMLGSNKHPGTASSNGTPNGVNGSAGGTSLSSPESAYSTGYSTDGTSPGASFPPEYYINIRTGTHYFQQGLLRPGEKVKPQPPPPPPRNIPPKQVDFSIQNKSPAVQKKEIQKKSLPVGHRRSESCDVGRYPAIFRAPPPPPPPPPPIEESAILLNPSVLASASPSPRQRSRIRTNPWVATNSPVGTTSSTSSQKYAEESTGSCSSGGLKKHTKVKIDAKPNTNSPISQTSRRFGEDSGSSSTTCSSANGTKLKVNHSNKANVLEVCRERSPNLRNPNPPVSWSPRRLVMKISGSSSSGSRKSSDDDLTLHEMMGKYDESYVYERETDILSDSDPTDCEECDTDIDTGQDGGDEQDPDDLDFIDKDSYLDLNLSDTERGPRRIGHSTYYHFPNELSRRLSRHRDNTRRGNNHSRKSSSKSRVPRRRRPRENNAPGSRSLGGTPLSHRRKHQNHASEMRHHHQSPSKISMQKNMFIDNSHIDSLQRRSNSISYVSRRCEVQTTSNGRFLANFDSEIALIEADKEADKKYKELILEAEHILVSMKANTPLLGSPRRIMSNPPTNKRVEILRNTEADLVPKPKNHDSVPGSPKLCNSPRFSPKKNHITNFIQMNSPELSRREQKLYINENVYQSPKKIMTNSPLVQRNQILQQNGDLRQACPNSPRNMRMPMSPASPVRKFHTLGNNGIPGSPHLQVNGRNIMISSPLMSNKSSQTTSPVLHIDDDSDESTEKESSIRENKPHSNSSYIDSPLRKDILENGNGKVDSQSGDSGSFIGGTSSSSDGDIVDPKPKANKDKTRPPLMAFRSVDMGHRVPNFSYCPQSEPVKRKVYSCSNTFDKLQKSLDKYNLMRQQSDGESSLSDDHDLLVLLRNSDECRNGLREKVTRLRNERLEMEERIKQHNDIIQQQQGEYQKLFKRQILLQTIEGLKRSLEDQSASLKQTYRTCDIK